MNDLDFNFEFDIPNQIIPEYTEEDARNERIMTLDCCCTCKNFKHFYASSGVCKLEKVIDKNVRFIDYLDYKCEKWYVCDEEKDFFESLK